MLNNGLLWIKDFYCLARIEHLKIVAATKKKKKKAI